MLPVLCDVACISLENFQLLNIKELYLMFCIVQTSTGLLHLLNII